MTNERAKQIMAKVLMRRNAARLLSGLLEERRCAMLPTGDPVRVGEINRTIEDLCGYWDGAVFVGAKTIAEAARITRGA